MKNLVLIILFFTFGRVIGQICYKNNHIEIDAHIDVYDSTVEISIKNISDSTLVFYDKFVEYYRNNGKYFYNLRIDRSGTFVPYEPSWNTVMNLRRFSPNEILYLNITFESSKNINFDSIELNHSIDYLVTANNLYLVNYLENQRLIKVLKCQKIKLYSFSECLVVDPNNKEPCVKVLKLK